MGIVVLILEMLKDIPPAALSAFPSPCGDYGSYRERNTFGYYVPSIWFPSPCGDYGSYPCIRRTVKSILKKGCFRPLTGIMVLILQRPRPSMKISASCFRPLTGIMVLIQRPKRVQELDEAVSVPLRGLWFLSTSRRTPTLK